MAIYHCPKCAARNTEAGRCVLCLAPLGSLSKAVKGALVGTLVMTVVWVAQTLVFSTQIPVVAGVYGALVAGFTTWFSGGRGLVYQLIATGVTIAGIGFSDSVAMSLSAMKGNGFDAGFLVPEVLWADMVERMLYDPATTCFCILGVMTSFCIWR